MKRMGGDQLCGVNIPVASGGEWFTLMWEDLHIKVDWQLFPPGDVAKIGIRVYAGSILPLCVFANCI